MLTFREGVVDYATEVILVTSAAQGAERRRQQVTGQAW